MVKGDLTKLLHLSHSFSAFVFLVYLEGLVKLSLKLVGFFRAGRIKIETRT